MSADRIAYLSVADFLDDENSGLVSRAYEAALHACARQTAGSAQLACRLLDEMLRARGGRPPPAREQ